MKTFLAMLTFVSLSAFGNKPTVSMPFRLWSPEVIPGATMAAKQVFKGFGCTGQNVSPELRWEGAPKGTKAFAVTMYDPDAPTGSGWWHWIVYNLPADGAKLESSAGDEKAPKIPQGAATGRSDFGTYSYGGPCPPAGDKAHRYIFTLFALKEKVDAAKDASAAMIGYQLNAKALDRTTFTASYGR